MAAHLGDLKAAGEVGMRTVYVEREGEESWGGEEVEGARGEGWVDLWVGVEEGEGGEDGRGGFWEVGRWLEQGGNFV